MKKDDRSTMREHQQEGKEGEREREEEGND